MRQIQRNQLSWFRHLILNCNTVKFRYLIINVTMCVDTSSDIYCQHATPRVKIILIKTDGNDKN